MAEDAMFEDLENMLNGPSTGKPASTRATKFEIGAAVVGSAGLFRQGSSSRIAPIADIDELEDMYDFDSKNKVKNAVGSKTTLESAQVHNRADRPPLPHGSAPSHGNKSVAARSILKAADKDDLDDELAEFDD